MHLRGDGPGGKFCCRICRAKVAQDTLERLFAEGLARVELSAAEVVEASAGNPRAAELTRILGGEPVALSEIWSALDRDQARQLVDLLVARIVVGRDEVSIVLAENDASAPESAPSPVNSLPSEHGSEADGSGSTNGGAHAPSRPAGSREDLPLLLPVEQAAEVLHTTPKAVYAMVQRGLLPGVVRVGRRVLIRRDELLDSVRGSRALSPKETRR